MPRLATVLALAALAAATPMQPNPVSQHEMSSSVSTPSPTSSPPSATPPSPGLKWAGEVQPGLFMTFNGDVKVRFPCSDFSTGQQANIPRRASSTKS